MAHAFLQTSVVSFSAGIGNKERDGEREPRKRERVLHCIVVVGWQAGSSPSRALCDTSGEKPEQDQGPVCAPIYVPCMYVRNLFVVMMGCSSMELTCLLVSIDQTCKVPAI